MKKVSILLSMILLCNLFSACDSKINNTEYISHTITDSVGNSYTIADKPLVVSCYGSFADMWQLSGGKLIGVTKDVIDEHKLPLPSSVEIIGTVKEVNMEKLISLNPDYVILSQDIAAHSNIAKSLESLNIPYGLFRVDTFSDYKSIMKQFCNINNRMDLFENNVTDVEKKIEIILQAVPKDSAPTFLVMRSFSTGIKVKNDNLAVSILKELGATDITDITTSLLKDFSLEKIITEDPDFIFVLTMGNETSAKENLFITIKNNPVWNELSAIKNNRFIVLPKDLFHYKPNNRWDESYEYLAKILYPKVFNQQYGEN